MLTIILMCLGYYCFCTRQ